MAEQQLTIIAHDGERYLVKVDAQNGMVVDLDQLQVYAPHSLDSILARGYWSSSEDQLSAVIDLAAAWLDAHRDDLRVHG